MIGKKVKWLMTWYGSDGNPTFRHGKVVHQEGDWLVIRVDRFSHPHQSPFLIKQMKEVERAD